MTNKLLEMIESHLQKAKTATSEQQLREEVVAIKTLCEVVLSTEKGEQSSQVATISNVVYPSISQTVKEEDDANCASIFDF